MDRAKGMEGRRKRVRSRRCDPCSTIDGTRLNGLQCQKKTICIIGNIGMTLLWHVQFAAILGDAFLQWLSPCSLYRHWTIPVDGVKKGGQKSKRKRGRNTLRYKEKGKDIVIRAHPRATATSVFVAHERAQSHTLSFSHWHLHCTFPCAATNASYKTYLFYVQKRNCSLNKRSRNNRYKELLSRISFQFR